MSVGPSICRVGRSVGRSVRNISELRAVFALLLLPNRPRLDCRVSGLIRSLFPSLFNLWIFFFKIFLLIQATGPQMGPQYEEGGLENTIQVGVIFNSILTTIV